jgi:fructokinase
MLGGIEAGGTKFVCGVGTGPSDLRTVEFQTTQPAETVERAVRFFRQAGHGQLSAVGIGSFGPVDLKPQSPTFGYITTTPKLPWRNFDLAGEVCRALGTQVYFDTDVNAAALGEHYWGAAKDLDTFLYLTIGTGIGGGGMANGRLMHGMLHPEMGHLRIPHDLIADPYIGCCPSHGDCLEGLASGPALEARWGDCGPDLPEEHPAWELEAQYLALGLANWICTLSPQRIIMGGGVMSRASLFPRVRLKVQALLNGYVQTPEILEAIDTYIVPPALGAKAGILGAIALAASVSA